MIKKMPNCQTMKHSEQTRRDFFKLGTLATLSLAGASLPTQAQEKAGRGQGPVKITMHANDRPGLGIDINEELAAKYPYKSLGRNRGTDRRLDGTIVRP
jgi:hypothetical protein